jgi:uroporphyrinogen III methyltransferase/synthase
VTRSRGQANQLADKLTELGADVIELPTIRFAEPTDRQAIADVLFELNSYEWLIFTSPNGVTSFFDYFFKGFDDLRDLGGARIAAVGPGTAAKLKDLHLRVDVMPEESVSSKIVGALLKEQTIENVKIAILRAEVANRELPNELEKHGAIVDDIACYKTLPETEDLTGAVAKFTETGADWITFTSSSTVNHFHQRFDLNKICQRFPQIKLASIGPETSKTIRNLKLEPTVEPKEHNINGLVNAIREGIKTGK